MLLCWVEDMQVDGWQDIIKLMIGWQRVARERRLYIYPTINHDGKTQQYTNWILQFMGSGCRINICADRWVKKDITILLTYVLPVYNVWGKWQKARQDGGDTQNNSFCWTCWVSRTKVKVGLDEKCFSKISIFLLSCYHVIRQKLVSSERVNCTCQAGLGL